MDIDSGLVLRLLAAMVVKEGGMLVLAEDELNAEILLNKAISIEYVENENKVVLTLEEVE